MSLADQLYVAIERRSRDRKYDYIYHGRDVRVTTLPFERMPLPTNRTRFPVGFSQKIGQEDDANKILIPRKVPETEFVGVEDRRARHQLRSFSNVNGVLGVNTGRDKIVCRFYMMGKCRMGERCPFYHPPKVEKKKEICKFFLGGRCQKGDACPFSHDLKSVPCRHFFIGGTCQYGDAACRFSHGPLTDDMRAQLEVMKASHKG
ncbi:Zinc finger C-x8-C-x5-C-x3-H type (and similar) [Carpediemonas membranifera]|uniref:Zinc finger C-x8-C-x5-C-x3-H type (And similar) n=1 Tax=Carpediemonas membranifera TaxID=201153 RepID=A0A8J6E446_9EUKA|nr:Zinc finger C-x8-C-x5-C-x3-H type (and similar) [Carpediemonas membranifera]|eukprot:KAG9396758.1 Zinc finger C-x8-C-x5-C-x3-H type (and similar) [Carpediemonas membranifera]